MSKYLYGAAVQGIQNFIFQTNKLRDIVGASELVEEISTKKFYELLSGQKDVDSKTASLELKKDDNCIQHTAGKIKYIFDTKEDCEKIVREFPKIIFEFALGVAVSQAVVKMDERFSEFKDAINELEKRLRIQRNRPMRSATLGLMGTGRSRQTGLPVVYVEDKNTHLDAGTFAKLQYVWETKDGKRIAKRHTTRNLCQKAFYDDVKDDQIAYDIEEITQNNDWIAVIHADGNGLGQVVQKVGENKDEFKKFSELLDKATASSAQKAYQDIKEKYKLKDEEMIPIRPIVLGGDDLTVVCRADIALEYATIFVRNFEQNTMELLGSILKDHKVFENESDKRLTACAGIAYIKSSFPFYYGYELAETLCSLAKKDAKDKKEIRDGKELPKSCLMFHKVQDSFTEEWSAIAKRELSPQPNISFEYGPYYVSNAKDGRMTVDGLKGYVKKLDSKEGNAVKSHLRQWMSLLHDNPEMAKQKLLRLKSMTTNKDLLNLIKKVTFEYKKEEQYKTPVYDILAIHTINTQTTKEIEQ